jgi:ABC-type branched-chain amino acid transport systems, periplasmic component
MKRISIFALLICALSLNACAQWYLFPGKKKQQQQTEKPAESMAAYRDSLLKKEAQAQLDSTALADSLVTETDMREDVFMLDIPDVIHIGLVLPLQASAEKPSDNFLDFYSGTLLALRELGSAGLKADLQVYDSADSKTSIPKSLIDDSDVIIGPVSFDELERSAALCSGKVLISPLEPKAAALAAAGPVVQAPSGWNAQVDELVRWIREELPAGETLYVMRDSTTMIQGEQSAYFIEQLQAGGIRYQSVLSIQDIPFKKGQKARVAIASERDNVITTAVRSLSIEGARNHDVILYGTARVRTNGIAQTDLHNTEAHLTLSYFIDYDDPAVRQFILAYRALFQGEPGSFAFQGYDTTHYFVTMCSRYGRQWHKKLAEYGEKGLQADFRFSEEPARINQAARRVIYNSDLTTERR